MPPIAIKNLIPLPPELPSDLATVADPFACALNGIEQLDVRLGDTVVILGTGPIGCWQAVMARDRGAARVFMTDVSGERLKIALDAIGHAVDDAWVAGEDNGVEEVRARTGDQGAERVSVAAPAKPAQQAALEMAAKRAVVVYFAGLPKHDPVSPLDMNQLHYKELDIRGAYGATHRQYRITMDYLDRKQDELAAVVTHRWPLEQIGDAFETIRAGTGLKMVIVPCEVRDRLRRRQPGHERGALRRGRDPRRIGLRDVPALVPSPDVGRAGRRRLERRGRARLPEARRRVPGGAAAIGGISFGTQLDGMVAVDGAGRPVRPAMIWMDRRAEAQAAALGERISPAEFYGAVGANLDSSHAVFKALWIRDEEPEVWSAVTHVMPPGSYVLRYVAGALAVDYSNASSLALLDPRTREWSKEALEVTGIGVEMLPELGAGTQSVGSITAGFADAERPRRFDGRGDRVRRRDGGHAGCRRVRPRRRLRRRGDRGTGLCGERRTSRGSDDARGVPPAC